MTNDWHWRADRPTGGRTSTGTPSVGAERFPSQGEAESWLGETYPDLLEGGVRRFVRGGGARGRDGRYGVVGARGAVPAEEEAHGRRDHAEHQGQHEQPGDDLLHRLPSGTLSASIMLSSASGNRPWPFLNSSWL